MADNEVFVDGFTPKELAHIRYIDDDEEQFPRLEGLKEGYAIVRKNSSVEGAADVSTVRTNIQRRFLCWVSHSTYVTNCRTTNLWSVVTHKRNSKALCFVPHPARPEALTIKDFFPDREDCLNFINARLRKILRDPTADIRNYQNKGSKLI